VIEDERALQRQAAILLHQSGAPFAAIATTVGVDERVGLKWIAEAGSPAGGDSQGGNAALDAERRRSAGRSLLGSWPPFYAEVPSDVEVGQDHVEVWFDDEAAHTLSDLVEESVAVIAAVPGVERAWREDTEFIMVYGSATPVEITGTLDLWWRDRLGGIV
jgi:hypothetical protein